MFISIHWVSVHGVISAFAHIVLCQAALPLCLRGRTLSVFAQGWTLVSSLVPWGLKGFLTLLCGHWMAVSPRVREGAARCPSRCCHGRSLPQVRRVRRQLCCAVPVAGPGVQVKPLELFVVIQGVGKGPALERGSWAPNSCLTAS